MPIQRDGGEATLGGVRLASLLEDARVTTPAYVYDLGAIRAEARSIHAAFEGAPHHVCYAVKANSSAAILRALIQEGCGTDVVSGTELLLSLACGAPADSIVFSGVAKTDAEIDLAIGKEVRAIQAESVEELRRVAARAAALGRTARVSMRVNPGLDREDIDTHSHIATGHDEAKFGVPQGVLGDALAIVRGSANLSLIGLAAHAGSQFTSTAPYVQAARALFEIARDLRKEFALAFVDTGGGFGVDYGAGCPVSPKDFVRDVVLEQKRFGLDDLPLFVEPGRSLVAAHGVLLARVIQTKVTEARAWLMIDAGMNDLIRPALYQALHRIVPVAIGATKGPTRRYRVVGPVCESSDDFGFHELPADPGPLVAILDAGAYGFTMASRYNGRALPTEVFLEGAAIAGVVPREGDEAWVLERMRSASFAASPV